MANKTATMQQFEQFASGRLKNHKTELDTRYQNEKIDKQTLEKAYREHKEIFNQELDEKIKELSSGQQQEGQKDLQNQKQTYLSKLNFKKN